MLLGRAQVDRPGSGGRRGWEADPLPWSGPARWLVGMGGLGCGWRARAVLHGVINLLTQGRAGPLWRVARCLAFCQPTNPLTRPEHALLTPAARPY